MSVVVKVSKGHGPNIQEIDTEKFDPQEGTGILAVLEKDYGTGKLLRDTGIRITPNIHVDAGQYMYIMTGAGSGGQAGGGGGPAGAYVDVNALADLLATRVKQELGPTHEALSDDIRSWHSSQAVNASQLKGAQLDAMRRQLRVVFLTDPDVDVTAVLAPEASVDSDFEWDNTPEPSQRGVYMAEITRHVQLDSRNLLWKTQIPARYLLLRGLGFSMAARSDELIAIRLFHNDPALGCVIGIELKKRLSHASRRQGEAELYTFGLTSHFPFVQVVTDMVRGGFAYWKSGEQEGKQVVHEKVLVDMGQVYEFLRQVLAALPSDLGRDVGGRLVMPQQLGTTYHVMKVHDPVVTTIQVPLISVEKGDVGNDALDDLLPWFDQQRLQDRPSYIS